MDLISYWIQDIRSLNMCINRNRNLWADAKSFKTEFNYRIRSRIVWTSQYWKHHFIGEWAKRNVEGLSLEVSYREMLRAASDQMFAIHRFFNMDDVISGGKVHRRSEGMGRSKNRRYFEYDHLRTLDMWNAIWDVVFCGFDNFLRYSNKKEND